MRRPFRALLPALALWLAWAAAAPAADRPNILLILSDDHSVPHLGAYGCRDCKRFDITPNLDRLAAEGMRFDRAYTAAPQCAPSRISIFTGRSPVGIGVTRFAQPARPDVPFFTDVLRANGYWAGLDGRHQHLDGRISDAEHIQEALRQAGMRSLDQRFDHFVRSASTKGANLAKVGEKFSAILDEVPAGKPFFLYFGFNQPHRAFGDDHENIDPAALELPPDWPDLPEVRVDYARFLDEVRDLDAGFGLIDQELERRGIKDDTLLIFMGDNGESLLRGKGSLWDRGTHVPLLVRWPGKIRAGSVTDAMVSGIDLGATMLAAAGLEPPNGAEGLSFLPALLGEPFPGREYVFAERGWHAGPITRTDGLDLSRSITSRRYRFIYNALPERTYTPVDMPDKEAWLAVQAAHRDGKLSSLHERLFFQNPRPLVELYDLQEDPYELRNLAGDDSLKLIEHQLQVELERWMILENDYLPLPTHVRGRAK
ncbi:MAG: sulfatase-like hydrolase/transferase [Acidobacteria bacterium]|nr:sulfatase-like hydrolase/transferase [Acidobacteriota bacterium]